MTNAYLLESLAWCLPMALLIYAVLKWASGQEKLKQEINPKTGEIGPPHLCRGGWNEGEIRGCYLGYATTGIPVEPVNTYSNLAYLAAGWVVYRLAASWTALVFCVAMAFLCFGSALYHGMKTRWSARWDHGGMYAVMAGLAFYVVCAGHAYETEIVLAGSLLSGILLAWFLDGYLLARMALLLALITVGVMTRGDAALGWTSLAYFAGALAVWLVDKYTGILGRFGHGLWHVLTAVALAYIFLAV